MARYRIKWRNILFNLPMVILLVNHLRASWPEVRAAAQTCVEANPEVADFIAAADQLFRIFARRR